jgi:hypothetical protein
MAYYMPEQHGLAQNGDSLYTEFIVKNGDSLYTEFIVNIQTKRILLKFPVLNYKSENANE